MREPFTIREFDSIICENEKSISEKYKQMPAKEFEALKEFIRNRTPDDDEADSLEFMNISYSKRGVGDIIHVKNYVGMIQMQNGYQVEILPKIMFDKDSEDRTKAVFIKMLRSMKDFPCKVFTNANVATERMNLYEIFINMYISEVRELVKRGLKSAYVPREDNLNFYKGKLMVNDQIKKNLAHKERFYVRYDEYQLNRPENRIIKATLLKLEKITAEYANAKGVRQLLTHFELVDASQNFHKDFAQVAIDRNTKAYETVLQWSKVFLMNRSFTTFSGDDYARALLFPMEKVFEAYVADNMKRVMRGTGWNVSTQDKGHYLFTEPKRFALRPDIVMTHKDYPPIILDTKWKRLIDNARKNYGISQTDMYQMYAYGKKYNTSEIWLLYPKNEGLEKLNGFTYDSGDDIKVHLFFVDVANIEESLENLKALLEENPPTEVPHEKTKTHLDEKRKIRPI